MDTASLIEPQETDELQLAPKTQDAPNDWWQRLVRSPLFVPMLFVAASLGWMYWHLISRLPRLWLEDDGYYSHGFLVPFIAGYVVYKKWDRIKSIPVRAGWLALPFMLGFAYLGYVTTHVNISAVLALSFLCSILTAIWFAAGFRWMLALAAPVLYLGFALPLWTGAIEFYTNPAQLASTSVAYQILKVLGFGPMRFDGDPTTIYLSHFTLDIAVPCSGLKLMLAVTAFTLFFMMIASLKWWGNLAMIGIILPLCVFVNGLRIAMIGMVGDQWGSDAGHQFHDWSGYLMLLICFFALFKIARGLGWKD